MNTKKEMVRFLISGSLLGAIDFGIYFLLIHFLPFSLAKGISFTCAGIVGYLLNKFWTFRNNQISGAEVGRYALVSLLALGINVVTNQTILNIWPGAVIPALIVASMLTGLLTYIGFKFWVYRIWLKERAYFVWWKWFPWRFLLSHAARRQGFLDPVKIISQLQNFAQPSEVAAPTELLRSGVVMHARGLINSLAIQHNLDWIWPYWVECQYNPRNEAFIPRSFSLTQINLTHRNWTALGVPDSTEFPIVDPRGLVTPFYDGWSIDVWMVPQVGEPLIPSRSPKVSQKMVMDKNVCVVTESGSEQLKLKLMAQVIGSAQSPNCRICITGAASEKARLVVSLRPYNPEGVSFINHITLLKDSPGWLVNGQQAVFLDKTPDQFLFSNYRFSDVYSHVLSTQNENEVSCKVGMASAAAIYLLDAGEEREIAISVPLTGKTIGEVAPEDSQGVAKLAWERSLKGVCSLHIPDKHFQFLYETAIQTMILHSPKEVYPGPFIYRRFWFRDAAFILNALLSVGLHERVRRALDCFRSRQTVQGYFLSQEGEWDSNGEALWIMHQYCAMTGSVPPNAWKESITKAGKWICKKRLPKDSKSPQAGLLPSGFSAEHLGPNDFYYWDDFWGVAGLKAAAFLCASYKNNVEAGYFESEAQVFLKNIDCNLKQLAGCIKRQAMPASPHRRMDSGAIGSLVASYPLRIFEQDDSRVLDTADFLMKKCLVHGGFFHDMTHSGINPYLTLHLAQVLLRSGDPRYFGLMTAVAKLASPTGQWPESVHPRTGGGCMGDGQHVWAAAEWVLMIRNCFVREEGDRLILCSGIPRAWLEKGQTISFGPAPTCFGNILISIKPLEQKILVEWQGQWFAKEPPIDIQFPGSVSVKVPPATNSYELKHEKDK